MELDYTEAMKSEETAIAYAEALVAKWNAEPQIYEGHRYSMAVVKLPRTNKYGEVYATMPVGDVAYHPSRKLVKIV